MNDITIELDPETLQDVINISVGLFSPLHGFMTEEEFKSCVEEYILPDGQIFTIPITLSISKDIAEKIQLKDQIKLCYNKRNVAILNVKDIYTVATQDFKKVFRTLDMNHPGVKKELEREPYRVGGSVILLDNSLLGDALIPEKIKKIFSNKGWKTIVGFQTRNPIHKAHEFLQRTALEICDGLFINPIVGWKKSGDFTQEAVMAAYNTMINNFYPKDRVYLKGLKTQMRYAGPREAIFHAIIRRNLGCTHFIIGRDHAGVGDFYGDYDAHELAKELTAKQDLGIQLLLLHEPYYCNKCDQIVTEKTCAHYATNRVPISGSAIRKYIQEGKIPDEIMLRKEIFKAILECKQIFIK